MEDLKKIKTETEIDNDNDNKYVVAKKSFTSSVFQGPLILFKNIFRMYFLNIILITFIIDNMDEILWVEQDYLFLLEELKKLKFSNILNYHYSNRFSICVCKNGVFSWGNNDSGQLGIGNRITQSSRQSIEVFQNPEEIISISCGYDFSICICKNGVFGWGNNCYGQLGIGNQINQFYPQKILFFKKPKEIISLSCGYLFSICVCKNGVFSWGNNLFGELGIESGNEIDPSSPQKILFFKNIEEIISISCGAYFCVSVCKNGVFSWGQNNYGQLGIGNHDHQSSPQQILFFENTKEIISLCCGWGFCVCICKNGVYSWGNNNWGQLGIKNFIHQSSPQRMDFFKNPEYIISLHCEDERSICIYKNGVYGWGQNFHKYSEHKSIRDPSFPQLIELKEKIESYSDLSLFTTPYNNPNRYKNTLLLILTREYDDPDWSLFGKDYLPRDMFNIIMNFI
jgi:alpha-tubulin suppressor-like RCC1 family protein